MPWRLRQLATSYVSLKPRATVAVAIGAALALAFLVSSAGLSTPGLPQSTLINDDSRLLPASLGPQHFHPQRPRTTRAVSFLGSTTTYMVLNTYEQLLRRRGLVGQHRGRLGELDI